MNENFSNLMKDLRKQMTPTAILILYGESIYAYFDNSLNIYDMNLQLYHKLKSISHYLVYYSIKHNKKYNNIADLCEKLRPAQQEYLHTNIDQLMEMATKEYLNELHRVVQLIKDDKDWPSEMLCIVSGPASPRFGHPAMQYFARLANKKLEQRTTSCQSQNVHYEPTDEQKYPGRFLFYVENAHSVEEAKSIGVNLLVEQKVMSQFADMSIDILAPNAMQYLQSVCRK